MAALKIELVNYQDKREPIQMIRRLVFQEEQGIDPLLEFDGYDEVVDHLLAYLDNHPVGTARIRCLNQTTAKIERLAVLPQARGQGVGKKLMEIALEIIEQQSSYYEVIVNAQEYIKNLYEKLSFEQVGDRFEEAGISHVKMIKYLKSN